MRYQDRELVREWFKAIKAKSSCHVCPEDDPAVLDFHHLNPATKTDTVASLVYKNAPISKIQTELHKCVPLCSNCHRKVHANKLSLL